jgi:thiol-disulfide isomerase/thioredoxin
MKRFLSIIIIIVFSFNGFTQEKPKLFSEEIKKHIFKYNRESDLAFKNGDFEKGQALFDSLVGNYLIGTKLDQYIIKCANGKKLKLDRINKPLLILTYSSWCVLNKAEIPALNKIAKKHVNDFQLVVLFWDKKRDIKTLKSKFNNSIKVCYANEAYNSDEELVSNLKHYLGFPTSYFITKDLEIIDIQKGHPQANLKTSYSNLMKKNLEYFQKRIATLLMKKEMLQSQIVVNEN